MTRFALPFLQRARLRSSTRTPTRRRGLLGTVAVGAMGLWMGLAQHTQAQTAATWPPADTLAQRLAACTACHGEQGRAGPDGYYPRLAGKPAGYLYHQLQHFQQERRQYRPMTHLLRHLDDAYLQEMAAFFANQQVPYPAPVVTPLTASQTQRARELVLQGDAARQVPACTACHGSHLMGALPATPGLLGLPRDYLNAQLGAWRNGLRRAHAPDCMADIARRLAPEDIAVVSAWLAGQPAPTGVVLRPLPAPAPLSCGGQH
jgi:cytochrome c553